jgi:outer membrane immunogenic protein
MKILIAAAALVALAGPALAADMAAAPVYSKAPAAITPVYDWTGFYAGLNGGGAWGSDHLTSTPADAGTTAFFAGCFVAGACPRDYGRGSNGANGEFGGQIGYNWQVRNFVVGIETDAQWTRANSNAAVSLANTTNGFVPFNGAASSQLQWFGTTRGRLGVLLAPTWLLYATGGVAYGSVARSWTANFPASGQLVSGASTQDAVGWTVGVGAEWKVAPHWSIGAEYLYIQFASDTFAATGVGSAGCAATNCNFNVGNSGLTANIARLKVNYEFGGPVVAKY